MPDIFLPSPFSLAFSGGHVEGQATIPASGQGFTAIYQDLVNRILEGLLPPLQSLVPEGLATSTVKHVDIPLNDRLSVACCSGQFRLVVSVHFEFYLHTRVNYSRAREQLQHWMQDTARGMEAYINLVMSRRALGRIPGNAATTTTVIQNQQVPA